MFRVITIEREFGSGAAEIARVIADRLGWKLWDQALTEDRTAIAARQGWLMITSGGRGVVRHRHRVRPHPTSPETAPPTP